MKRWLHILDRYKKANRAATLRERILDQLKNPLSQGRGPDKKRVLAGFLLLYAALAQAKLTVELERDKISRQQSFRLTLTDDRQSSEVPDLTPLQKDFNIVGSEKSTSYSVINGRTSSSTQWTVLLVAKRTGTLTIPPLQVGSQQTTATRVEVSAEEPVQKQDKDKDQEVFLTARVSEQQPYVNQQVIYIMKLYTSKRLLDTSFQDVQVADALVMHLGEGRRYEASENGRPYLVQEQQYAIFPQKSGTLKIIPPSLSALVYDTVPRKIQARADAISLQVKPVPVQATDKKWLPAKHVRLTEEYDRRDTTLTQGTTLVRTVSLQAVGLPAQLVPALHFAGNDRISVYPEKPVENNNFNPPDLTGVLSIKVTYLFNKPGKTQIPALELPWFNTVTGRSEMTVLPELEIDVLPLAGSQPAATTKPVNPSLPPTPGPEIKAPVTLPGKSSNLAWWIAAFLACAWLLTLGLWWRGLSMGKTAGKRQLLKALKDACLANRPEEAEKALLRWANWQWPKAGILNLANVQEQVSDPGLKQQIEELSKVIYRSGRKTWQGEALWQSISSYRPCDPSGTKVEKSLPGLSII